MCCQQVLAMMRALTKRSLRQGNMVVRVGNDVQLAASHGGAEGRIARIEALWAEPPQRCLGNLCNYYRPEARPNALVHVLSAAIQKSCVRYGYLAGLPGNPAFALLLQPRALRKRTSAQRPCSRLLQVRALSNLMPRQFSQSTGLRQAPGHHVHDLGAPGAQETVFAGAGGAAELFASAFVEPRVPLDSVARRVSVARCPPGAPAAPLPRGATHRCCFLFDPERDALTLLSPCTLVSPAAPSTS